MLYIETNNSLHNPTEPNPLREASVIQPVVNCGDITSSELPDYLNLFNDLLNESSDITLVNLIYAGF
jgi:hypothetical protein